MNQREAMVALLAGHKLTADTFRYERRYLELNESGSLRWNDGSPASLGSHNWCIYEEPNPHTKGTLAWAREEVKRGNGSARRPCWLRGTYTNFGPALRLLVQDIDGDDWEMAR